jgi:hypothetical protein
MNDPKLQQVDIPKKWIEDSWQYLMNLPGFKDKVDKSIKEMVDQIDKAVKKSLLKIKEHEDIRD